MKRILAVIVLVVVMVIPFVVPAGAAPTLADSSMQSLWQRTDQPVENLQVARTWLWGSQSFATMQEPYAEAPGGMRTVVYFEKSRMEITNPNGDRNSKWFVTNGLLAKELVTGWMQTGDNTFEYIGPSESRLGDSNDFRGPSYATFRALLNEVEKRSGPVNEWVEGGGAVREIANTSHGVTYAYYVPETGHNIASVFWDFLNSTGKVSENGRLVDAKLFDPTFFATGFPITEPYWAWVGVGGGPEQVLVQVFERRVLTYNPSNPDGWKVEMGNDGSRYYQWRHPAAYQPQPVLNPDPGADVPDGDNNQWIMPKYGPPGTTFFATASMFWRGEAEIRYWVNGANGVLAESSVPLHADQNGRIVVFPLKTIANAKPGIYSVSFKGVSSGHQTRVFFKIVAKDQLPAPLPPAGLPIGWTMIDDSANGYKVGVPEGWRGFTASSPEMQQFITGLEPVNPQLVQSLRQGIAGKVITGVLYDPSADPTVNSGLPTYAVVYREKMSSRMTAAEYLPEWFSRNRDFLNMPVTQDRIAGQDSDLIMLRYHWYRANSGPTNGSGVSVIGTAGDYAYELSMATTVGQESNYAPLFDQIARHFQILPAS